MAAARGSRTLITIPFSSYCEQARWALDVCGVAFQEKHTLPMMHMAVVKAAQLRAKALRGPAASTGAARGVSRADRGHSDRASSSLSVPVLIDNGDTPVYIPDSRLIMRYADEEAATPMNLFPPAATGTGDAEAADGSSADATGGSGLPASASDIVDYLHDTLGPHARRVGYDGMLREKELVTDLIRRVGTMPVQSLLVSVGYSVLVNGMTRGLNLRPKPVARSLGIVEQAFDDVAERLASPCAGSVESGAAGAPPFGRFLAGPSFTAADIAFASLASPVLLVSHKEGFGSEMVGVDEAPEPTANLARRLRQHDAGKHAMWVFANCRTAAQLLK